MALTEPLSGMIKGLAIAVVNLRRLVRDRIGLFFIFVLPLVLILTIGSVFGGGFTPKLGVVNSGGGPLAADLIADLKSNEDIDVEVFDDRGSLQDAVERGSAEGGLVVPTGYENSLRSGGNADLSYLGRSTSFSSIALQRSVQGEIDVHSARLRAARFAAEESGVGFQSAFEQSGQTAAALPDVTVTTSYASGNDVDVGGGRFDFGAAQELILFMFLTSLSASSGLIQTRRLGVSRRMISTPTSVFTVLAGETIGRFGIAMLQGLFIVLATWLLFGVDWGDPIAAGTLIVLFALVGTGAAMLFGALFNNEEQANSVGVFAGLGLAALGGCMVPLEVFPPTMEKIAHLTPHAWAVQGLTDVVIDNAGPADVAADAGILALFAIVLLGLATWRLHRSIVAG